MTVAITRMERTAAELRQYAACSADASVARRLMALALVLDGHKREDAARAAGMDRQTLCDWVHRYNADGIAGLGDRHVCPRQTFAERLPGVASSAARRTERLGSLQGCLGLALGGEAGQRLAERLADAGQRGHVAAHDTPGWQ